MTKRNLNGNSWTAGYDEVLAGNRVATSIEGCTCRDGHGGRNELLDRRQFDRGLEGWSLDGGQEGWTDDAGHIAVLRCRGEG